MRGRSLTCQSLRRHGPSLQAAFLFALASRVVLVSPAAAQTPPQAAWYDGGIQYSNITNCVSIIQGYPYQELGAGAFVGFYADPNNGQPAPNTTYYVRVYVAGLGNACSGQRFFVDVQLPQNTTLAIDGSNPVRCFAGGVLQAQCPQSLPSSPYNAGAFALLSSDTQNANLWPLPPGATWEFQIPVRTTALISNSPLQANVWVLDGNSSPWLRPQQGVWTFSGGAQVQPPSILYDSPSTRNKDGSTDPSGNVRHTLARSEASLYTNGTAVTGTGYFDLGTDTTYSLITETVQIPGGYKSYLVWDEWGGLQPDTVYYWRFRFQPAGGSMVYGAAQSFRTLPDGRVVVGTGTPGSCTEAAFAAALVATTKQVAFNCGASPVTIPITAARSAPGITLTIEGDNKVTLQRSGSGGHFTVASGKTLALNNLTISDARNTACGGAIAVASGGTLALAGARLVNNQTTGQGGAICNNGTTTVTRSHFSGNASTGSHGGAIANLGPASLTVSDTRFLNNSSIGNGGAIEMGGTVSVSGSTFTANTAGWRGGGVNSYGGNLTLTDASFLNNTAGIWGGGLASDSSNSTVARSTFSTNAAPIGGGIEINGPGTFALTNSTVVDNTAVNEGGGIYWWNGGAATPVAPVLLNNTLTGNSAGTTGGNIHEAGASASVVSVKNTIVAGGLPGNCSRAVASAGFNLEDANTCGFISAGDKRQVNPLLGPLASNGGTTLTRMPASGSQAIDGGTNAGCAATDQRGLGRPMDGDFNSVSVCDVGAVEMSPFTTVTRISPAEGPMSGGQVVTITGTNLNGARVFFEGTEITPVATTSTSATFTTPPWASAVPVTVAVNGPLTGTSLSSGYRYYSLNTPGNFSATAVSTSQVNLSWSSVAGASGYEVWRRFQGGQFALLRWQAGTSMSDTGLTAGTSYVYRVRATGSPVTTTSGFSRAEVATTQLFTDASLAGVRVKAAHVTELRAAVNAMRLAAGLDAAVFTDPTLSAGSTIVRRVHLAELRAALDAARWALDLPAVTYTDPALAARATVIKAVHLAELRAGTQ